MGLEDRPRATPTPVTVSTRTVRKHVTVTRRRIGVVFSGRFPVTVCAAVVPAYQRNWYPGANRNAAPY